MKKLVLVLLLFAGQSFTVQSQTQTKIISSSIDIKDVEKSNKMLELLGSKNKKKKQAAIDSVLANPNSFNPTVTYMLSNLLLDQDKKNEEMFWFYLSQVRARVDANICKDNTAKQAVSILNMTFGPAINKIAFLNLDTLKVVVEKVVAFIKSNEETYDRRWINLHGMDAVISGLDKDSKQNETSEPIDKWADIKKTTVESYYNDFIKYAINKEKD